MKHPKKMVDTGKLAKLLIPSQKIISYQEMDCFVLDICLLILEPVLSSMHDCVRVASHSSAPHPAVINRILSSDNAVRKQTLVHLSLRSSSGTQWHKNFLPFMVKMCKSGSKIEETHNAVGIRSSVSNNTFDLTPGVNHLDVENKEGRPKVVFFFFADEEAEFARHAPALIKRET